MKKLIYKGLYQMLLTLSNQFSNRFLTKCKIFLGTSLLVITSSCDKGGDDEPELMCYDPMPPQKTEEIEFQVPSPPAEDQINFTDIH